AEGCDSRPGESTALALPSTPPGTYWTGTRERRWTVSGTVTSRTRREWLRMMSAVGAGVLVDRLLPRRLAYAAADRQDPLAAFRAQLGAIPIQAQPLAENLTLLSGPGGNVVVLRGTDGMVVVGKFVAQASTTFTEHHKGIGPIAVI